jgi:hypothetical protein
MRQGARTDIAMILNVSRVTVQRARVVQEKGTPVLARGRTRARWQSPAKSSTTGGNFTPATRKETTSSREDVWTRQLRHSKSLSVRDFTAGPSMPPARC